MDSILARATIEAVVISREISLPPPIPFPKVSDRQDKPVQPNQPYIGWFLPSYFCFHYKEIAQGLKPRTQNAKTGSCAQKIASAIFLWIVLQFLCPRNATHSKKRLGVSWTRNSFRISLFLAHKIKDFVALEIPQIMTAVFEHNSFYSFKMSGISLFK